MPSNFVANSLPFRVAHGPDYLSINMGQIMQTQKHSQTESEKPEKLLLLGDVATIGLIFFSNQTLYVVNGKWTAIIDKHLIEKFNFMDMEGSSVLITAM